MVSQMELEPSGSNAVARRGPSSVTSSSRHRRGRRQGGGYVSNEFPEFSHTGDVEILVKVGSRTNRYLLHRLILTQCSGFFEASTSQEWSRAEEVGGGGELARIGEDSEKGSARNNREVKKRWRYELDTGVGNDDIPMLVQKENTAVSLFGANDAKPPPVRNKPPTSNPSFFRSVANLTMTSSHGHAPSAPISHEDQEILTDYDNLFRIFYNYPPALDAVDIATAYRHCKSLLTLADLYDALAVVGPRIDHHLLQFNSRLWKQIAKYPSSYLRLGYLAQSKTIFQESLIHVVGAWPQGERHIRAQLPDSVLEIIEDKVEDLADMVGKVEGKLFRLSLTTSRGERVTPYNSHLDWLVISLFRSWLADATSPPPPPAPTSRSHQPPRSSNGHNHHSRTNTTSSASGTTTQTQLVLSPTSSASHHNNHPSAPSTTPPTSHIGRAFRTIGADPSTYLGHEESSHHNNHPSAPSTTPPTSHIGRAFRTIGADPSTYLGHEECKRFLKLTPEVYSRDNMKKFERRMEEIKGLAREVVRPLMRSYLLGTADSGFLSCVRVGERDFVWLE
ncbi:hypothetical protein HYFRA_00011711 [Hymenoscyphus fraxineus]|uniref:BTB domain-containing protein n=1 Tax=Hymenoscyphus fraxineus TaxID=746836 RepID=A0A9N9L2H7_9HELO|nr:hypothetical protein HYFRA_00011711 [Hymenoscyphus fraxineus]